MDNLSVIYYTANRINSHFEENVKRLLLEAIGDLPLVSVSQKPMDFGYNVCVGDIGQKHFNIYRQILTGAKTAGTKYVALTEDDILYPPEHFSYRPSREDVAAYDMHKWSFYTWCDPPVYHSSLGRHTTGCIIARQMLIEALEERFTKYPDEDHLPAKGFAEIGRHERRLGVTTREVETFYPSQPHVVFFHEAAMGYKRMGTRKKRGKDQAVVIPYWGDAGRMAELYYA